MGGPPPRLPPPRPRPSLRPSSCSGDGAQTPGTRLPPLRVVDPPAGSSAPSAAPASSTATRTGFSVADRCALKMAPLPTLRPPLRRGPTQGQDSSCSGSSTAVTRLRPPADLLRHKRGRSPPSSATGDRTKEDEEPAATRRRVRRVLFTADPTSSTSPPPTPRPRLGGASTSDAIGRLPRSLPSSSRTGPTPRPATAPSASSSQAGINLYWNGPGLHRFHGREQLLLSVVDLNRFLHRREELCILQNAQHFLRLGMVNDAQDDPCRQDYAFLVVSRRTLLEMGDRARAVEGRFWPGYKEAYYELSAERKISTLKIDENTFLWCHEVSSSRLLRRRVSLDNDEGPFEDDSKVFYILQYHKLPRMRKGRKALVLADRARKGYY